MPLGTFVREAGSAGSVIESRFGNIFERETVNSPLFVSKNNVSAGFDSPKKRAAAAAKVAWPHKGTSMAGVNQRNVYRVHVLKSPPWIYFQVGFFSGTCECLKRANAARKIAPKASDKFLTSSCSGSTYAVSLKLFSLAMACLNSSVKSIACDGGMRQTAAWLPPKGTSENASIFGWR